MLKDVSLYFALHGKNVSVIARNENKMNQLILSKDKHGFINPILTDYKNSIMLKQKISNAIDSFGEIETAVCWIHSTAPHAPFVTAEILNNQKNKSKYFHILGSEYASPGKKNAGIEKKFFKYSNLNYKKIILGFVNENSGSRWLSNTEISNGVIDAINKEADSFIVGTVERWENSPWRR